MVFNRELNAFTPLRNGAQPTQEELTELRRRARAQGFQELRQAIGKFLGR